MAEMLVGSALASATAAAPAVGAGVGILGSSGGLTLGGLLSAASAGLSVVSGFGQQSAMKSQAQQAEFNARQAQVQGLAEGNRVREQALRQIAAQNARFAGAGFDLGSGTPVTFADEAEAAAARDVGTVQDSATIQAGQQRMTAQALRSRGSAAAMGGVLRGGFSLLDRLDLESVKLT
jgi:hypothetical protein